MTFWWIFSQGRLQISFKITIFLWELQTRVLFNPLIVLKNCVDVGTAYLDIFHIWQLLNFSSKGKIRIRASTPPPATSQLSFLKFSLLKIILIKVPSLTHVDIYDCVGLSFSLRIPQRPSIRRDITLVDWRNALSQNEKWSDLPKKVYFQEKACTLTYNRKKMIWDMLSRNECWGLWWDD